MQLWAKTKHGILLRLNKNCKLAEENGKLKFKGFLVIMRTKFKT